MADGLTLITSGFSNRLLLTVRKRGLIKKDLVFEFYVYMQVIASQAGGHPTKVMMMMMSFMFLFLSETKLCLYRQIPVWDRYSPFVILSCIGSSLVV